MTIFLVVVTGFSLRAEAVPLGQCFSSQQSFIKAMISEGQHTYSTGMTIKNGILGTAMVFSDDKGNGYYSTSDVSPKSPDLFASDHELCVDSKLVGVTLLDARISGIPNDTEYIENKISNGNNGKWEAFNGSLIKQSVFDMNVMIVATVTESRPNGLGAGPSSIFTVTGRVTQDPMTLDGVNYMHPGRVGFSNKEGEYKTINMVDTGDGTYAAKKLEERLEVANMRAALDVVPKEGSNSAEHSWS